MTKLPDSKPIAGSVAPATKSKRTFGIHVNRTMLVTLVVLAVFAVLITSNQATNGSQLASLQQERDQLQQDIARLQRQTAQASSLTYIRQYATEKMGMVTVDKNVLYQTDPTQPTTP